MDGMMDEEEGKLDAFRAAANEVYAAAKADDPNRFAVALKSAIEICLADSEDDDGEEY